MTHFRQLFDAASSAYSYLFADAVSREALVVDPVREQAATVLAWLRELDLTLRFVLETHVHADHVTGAGELRTRTGAAVVVPAGCGVACADLAPRDGDTLALGDEVIRVLATPGHTPGCVSYLWRDRVFTGDSLLIDGCGRTDLEGGDAGALYDSVTRRLFTLPGDTLVYPGHDYRGRTVSTIAEERARNRRFAGRSRDEFITQMAGLGLPRPRQADRAIPANRRCGKARTHAA